MMRLILLGVLVAGAAYAAIPESEVRVVDLNAVADCHYMGRLQATSGEHDPMSHSNAGVATREEALVEARHRGANRVVWRGPAVGGPAASPPGMLFRCIG